MDPSSNSSSSEENSKNDVEEDSVGNGAVGGRNSNENQVQESSKEPEIKENTSIGDNLTEDKIEMLPECQGEVVILRNDALGHGKTASTSQNIRHDKYHASDRSQVLDNKGMVEDNKSETSLVLAEYTKPSASGMLVTEEQEESNIQEQQMSDMKESDSLNDGYRLENELFDSSSFLNEEEDKEVDQKSLGTSVAQDDIGGMACLKVQPQEITNESVENTILSVNKKFKETYMFEMIIRMLLALFFRFYASHLRKKLSVMQENNQITSAKWLYSKVPGYNEEFVVFAVRIRVVPIPIYGRNEAYRLSTFGRAVNLNLEPGVVMQLARQGFLYDDSGSIVCFFCGHVIGVGHLHRVRCDMNNNIQVNRYGIDLAQLLVNASARVVPSGMTYTGEGTFATAVVFTPSGMSYHAQTTCATALVVSPSGMPYTSQATYAVARQNNNCRQSLASSISTRRHHSSLSSRDMQVQESGNNTTSPVRRLAQVQLPQRNNHNIGSQQTANLWNPRKFQGTNLATLAAASTVQEDSFDSYGKISGSHELGRISMSLTGDSGSLACMGTFLFSDMTGAIGSTSSANNAVQESGRSNRENVQYRDRRYAYVDARITSFERVDSCSVHQTPQAMALAGFYYIGPRDRMRCFSCSVVMDTWRENDDPVLEHVRESPDCDFIQAIIPDILRERPDLLEGIVTALMDSSIGSELRQLRFRTQDIAEVIRRLLDREVRVSFESVIEGLESIGAHPS